ncbi:MAG: hypothetical protein EOM77_00585 [Bacteroidia bacterium]|nr:hypothetical protein [Bacteroidia bacterium]
MVILPSVDQKRYERNLSFYKRQSAWAIGSFCLVELILVVLTILGFTVLPRLVAGFALTHLLILPFVYLHNFKLVMDFRYFGVKDEFSFGALFLHVLILLAIEICVVFTSFVFLENAPTWLGASGLAVSMALILLLIIERKTYGEVRLLVDYDRGLYKDNIVKVK